MSQRLVALNDVLRALTDAGPLSTDALARRLKLSKFDARLALVDAHAHGLVRTNSRGDWMISDVGHEALATDFDETRPAAPVLPNRWSIAAHLQRLRASGGSARLDPRYLIRRGLPLALGAIACAGGVAVASGRLEGAEGPAIVTTHAKAPPHRRHTHARGAEAVALRGGSAIRHRRRSTLVSANARVHRRGLPLIRQNHRRPQSRCGQRHQARGRRARSTRACASNLRQGTLRSGGGGSRSGQNRRPSRHTGSGGSTGQAAISPPVTAPAK